MPTVRKHSSKNIEMYSFLGAFPRSPVDVLEDVKKSESLICFAARNVNEEDGSIILQTKISQDDFKSIATSSSHKTLAEKWWR